ncbi:MAG: zinc-ribbon domain-containing protein, partial [Rhodobacterales bacterium]|nr:zinc-ribbon domain-containing protein [Rhodobacterales bacterium]
MRLICPNCGAQYEVDDAAIPPEGRDVQCSACGHAWYQLHPDAAAEAETDDERYEPVPATVPISPAPPDEALEAALARAQRDLAA